jgi:hypothetical protein
MCGIVGVEFPARKRGIRAIKGDPALHVGCRSHVKIGSGGRFIQFGHSSVLHRPFDGQIKHFKGTEENKAVHFIIWASFVGSVLRLVYTCMSSIHICINSYILAYTRYILSYPWYIYI